MKNKNSILKRIQRAMAFTYTMNFIASFLIICISFLFFINIFGSSISQNISYYIASSYSDEWNGKVSDKVELNNQEKAKFLLDIIKVKFLVDKLGENQNPIPQNNGNISLPKSGDLNNYDFFLKLSRSIVNIDVQKNEEITANNTNNFQRNERITDLLFESILNTEAYTEVVDNDNNVIGKVTVSINKMMITGIYTAIVVFCFIILLVVFMISKVIAKLLSNMIIRPIVLLQKEMDKIADGNIQEASETEIKFAKPVQEIEDLLNANKKIMGKMKDYIDYIEQQKAELEAQGDILSQTNGLLNEKMGALKNLLDNAGEGYLSFDESLIIKEQYSLECEKILGNKISGINLSEIFYSDNMDEKEVLDDIFKRILLTGNEELYMPLLPSELTIYEKTISIRYRLVTDNRLKKQIMVIITDITDKKELENEIINEKNSLKMIVNILLNREEFLSLIREYREFVAMFMTLGTEQVFKKIHSFKGNFAQYDLINIAKSLHKMEEHLASGEKIIEKDIKSIEQVLDEDILMIEGYVGKSFFVDEEIFHIKKGKLIELENRIKSTFSEDESEKIIPLIKRLRYKSLKELLKNYCGFTFYLAQRIEKEIIPFEIQGEDILVETELYSKLINSLVHIFRNAIYHGIESVEERIEKDKVERGKVQCNIKRINKTRFQIIIEDDGKGINIENIEKKAVEKQIIKPEDAFIMTLDEKLRIIFKHKFSTLETENAISGRGVGLAAVLDEVERVKGTIDVYSNENEGTKFIITIPFQNEDIETEMFEKQLSESMIKAFENYFDSNIQTPLQLITVENEDSFEIQPFLGIVQVYGDIKMSVCVSVNKNMMEKIFEQLLLQPSIKDKIIKEENKITYYNAALGELINMVVGNWFGQIEDMKMSLEMSQPKVTYNEKCSHKGVDCHNDIIGRVYGKEYVSGNNGLNVRIYFVK